MPYMQPNIPNGNRQEQTQRKNVLCKQYGVQENITAPLRKKRLKTNIPPKTEKKNMNYNTNMNNTCR